MIKLTRNNLDTARSPYLRQHKDNPVHWQEWSSEVLREAETRNKPLFVSVGYSTCHWCHVMAREAFSDERIASFLNEAFIPIKVDREERPDIDQYLMNFLVATTGAGGWPMNAFLSPKGAPFFAMTYAPVEPKHQMPGFLEILERVLSFYEEKKGELRPYEPESYARLREQATQAGSYDVGIEQIRVDLYRRYDNEQAGFGDNQKFPPHSQLLYLLFDGAASGEQESLRLAEQTLDTICLRGLHDHLEGGFFRYCVDREWRIPHFEKMLYDQAMLLWSLSWGYRLLGKDLYRNAIDRTVRFLDSRLEIDGLYASGLDADTNHQEGATYLWDMEELKSALTDEEHDAFARLFESSESGNFEGKLHLVAMSDPWEKRENREILSKLLDRRSRRAQPERDDKILTSWNALLGCALLEAYRATGVEEYRSRAIRLHRRLLEENTSSEGVFHSSMHGSGTQEQGFLEDYASLLLLETYLLEEGELTLEELSPRGESVLEFRSGQEWLSNRGEDFFTIPSDLFDSPLPAPASIAELGILRRRMLAEEEYEELPLSRPFLSDFYNLAARFSAGEVYLVKTPELLPWQELPFPAIRGRAPRANYCFRGVCYFGVPKPDGSPSP